jgi:hypothetical protein
MYMICVYAEVVIIRNDTTFVCFVQDVDVDVVAVLNDTTGTLMAGSYLDKHCKIGLIMGKVARI